MGLVLAIQGSPRKGGNAQRLLDAFLEGVRRNGGAKVEVLHVGDLAIGPCQGCRFCEEKGYCRLSDEMDRVYGLLREADLVVCSTPVFFYGVPAQLKALIDRSQALWARRYILGLRDPKSPWRKGFTLAVGATKGKNLFVGIELTMKYFFDAVGAAPEGLLGFRQVDKPGEIALHPSALDEARQKGKELWEPMARRRRVLFVCRENACRSQMAEAFLQFYGGNRYDVLSAGEEPAGEVNPKAVEAMAERGIDLTFRRPKRLEDVADQGPFDLVVTMGCEVACPAIPAKRVVDWDLEDPKGKPMEVFRRVRDHIDQRVKELMEEG